MFFYKFFSKAGKDYFVDTDKITALERQKELLKVFQDKDKEAFRNMFSREAIEQIENFDEKTDELFDYFVGDIVSYNEDGPVGTADSFERSGKKQKKLFQSFNVKTSVEEYRMAMYDCVMNTQEPDKIGIFSLYIVKESESPSYGFAYWGDGKETIGINIGITDNAQPHNWSIDGE